MAATFDVRCSVLVVHRHAVLLVHRTHDGLNDWVLPGGTPREGESLVACAHRELLEETGVSASPSGVALVVESMSHRSGRPQLDIVFHASEPVIGRERCQEPGMRPQFATPDQLPGLTLHPTLARQLIRLLDPGPHEYAPYVSNVLRAADPARVAEDGQVDSCPLLRQ
jgi:8-oxo-dGTP diphosphatase